MNVADEKTRVDAQSQNNLPESHDASDKVSEQIQAEMNARIAAQGFERPWNTGWETDARALEDDQSYWLLTMVDLMTLLLTLFVLLAAYAYHQKNTAQAEPASGQQARQGSVQPEVMMPGKSLPTAGQPNSTDNKPKITTQQGVLIATAPPNDNANQGEKAAAKSKSGSDADKSQEEAAKKLFSGLGKDVDISVIKGRINLRVRDNILFSTGDANLSGKGTNLIDRLATRLKQGSYAISVEGHTDNRPIHTNRYPSNWELSAARASAVLRELIRQGVAADRLSAVGFADTKPIAPNDTATGQAANRRVDLVLHLPGKKP